MPDNAEPIKTLPLVMDEPRGRRLVPVGAREQKRRTSPVVAG